MAFGLSIGHCVVQLGGANVTTKKCSDLLWCLVRKKVFHHHESSKCCSLKSGGKFLPYPYCYGLFGGSRSLGGCFKQENLKLGASGSWSCLHVCNERLHDLHKRVDPSRPYSELKKGGKSNVTTLSFPWPEYSKPVSFWFSHRNCRWSSLKKIQWRLQRALTAWEKFASMLHQLLKERYCLSLKWCYKKRIRSQDLAWNIEMKGRVDSSTVFGKIPFGEIEVLKRTVENEWHPSELRLNASFLIVNWAVQKGLQFLTQVTQSASSCHHNREFSFQLSAKCRSGG